MREPGRGEGLRRDAAGLEQLQRDLAGGRELDPAADREHPPDRGERQRDRACLPLERRQRLLEQIGGRADPVGDLGAPAGGVARRRAPSAATWFEYVLVAATERSGPAASGSATSAARASSESVSFVTRQREGALALARA